MLNYPRCVKPKLMEELLSVQIIIQNKVHTKNLFFITTILYGPYTTNGSYKIFITVVISLTFDVKMVKLAEMENIDKMAKISSL